MEDSFDKQIKQQVDDYRVQPREWVWPRVEAELDKNKKRRVAAWWWVGPLLVLLNGAGYWLYSSRQVAHITTPALVTKQDKMGKQDQAETASPTQSASSVAGATQKTEQPADSILITGATDFAGKEQTKSSVTDGAKTNENGKNNTVATVEKSRSTNASHSEKNIEKVVTHRNETVEERSQFIVQAGHIAKKKKTDIAEETDGAEANGSKGLRANKEQVSTTKAETVDSVALQQPVNTTEEIAATTAEHTMVDTTMNETKEELATTTKTTQNIRPQKQPAVWSFQVGGGKANIKDGSLVSLDLSKAFREEAVYNTPPNSQNPGNPGTGSGTAAVLPLEVSKAVVSFNVGVQRAQQLSKRWQWQAAAYWQYQQISQPSGQRRDSMIYYSATNSFSQSSFYTGGSQRSQKGYTHRVGISNQLAYSLSKKRQSLLLLVGLNTGFNIGNTYLIPDKINQYYLVTSNRYSQWYLGGSVGLQYVFKNNWMIGVEGFSDFTRAFKPVDNNPLYWRGWQLKAGIPILKKLSAKQSK